VTPSSTRIRSYCVVSGPTYEVCISGQVPGSALVDLGDVEVGVPEVRTVVRGSFEDQAALYGFLHRLRAFGLEVIEVRRVPAAHSRETPTADGGLP
jgi:hypothetical protein